MPTCRITNPHLRSTAEVDCLAERRCGRDSRRWDASEVRSGENLAELLTSRWGIPA